MYQFLRYKYFQTRKFFYAYTNWYRKDTFSSRYLNYYSRHNITQKIAIVYNIIDKCFLLSDNRFHYQNIKLAKNFLLANNYPINFFNKYTQKRITHIKQNKNNFPKINNQNHNNTIVLPFYKHLNPNIQQLLKNSNIFLINKNTDKLNSIIKLGKDKIDKFYVSNVVYKIKCSNCDFVYIGQTLRKLKKRILDELKKDYDNKDTNSVFYKHHLQTNHIFDFNKVSITDNEKNYYRRTFSEMLHIQFHPHTLNRQNDTKNYTQHIKIP